MNFNLKLNKLNITCIHYSNLSDSQGSTAELKNILYIFKKSGIKTDLISHSYYSNKFRIEHKKINPILNLLTIHLPSFLPKFIKAFSIFLTFVYAWGPSKKCDIIFTSHSALSLVPAVILGNIFSKPVILHYTDMERYFPYALYKYIAKNVDIVFAISPYLINKAKGYGCGNIVYLPPFVDTNLFKMDTNARKRTRVDFRIKAEDIVIGYAGSFWYVEGISNLLQAFKNLLKRYSNIKMIIVGGKKGINNADIPTLVKELNLEDKVVMVPPQPHEDIPRFLSACDITCCPKIDCEINSAANPIKVPEYLSMGLPTVCSAVGGIVDTIEDGVDGFLVKPGDVKDIEEKLEWIILNPERAKEIGENGRKTAIENYSFEAIEDTIKESIIEIIARKRKR